MKQCSDRKRGFWRLGALVAGTALGLAMTGCGGSSKSTGPIPPTSQVNQYFGSANPIPTGPRYYDGGVWSVTLDKVTSYFNYHDVDTFGGSGINSYLFGNAASTPHGFLDLTLSQGTAGGGGYAASLPGEGLLLRTGSSQADALGGSGSAVIGAAVSNACPALNSPQTYNFIAEGTTYPGDSTPHVAYGSLQIATGSAGASTFSNLKMYTLAGDALSPAPFPDATCPSTPQGFVLVAPLPSTETNPGPSQITVGISPSGLLVVDQGQNNGIVGQASAHGFGPTGPIGLLGVAQPAAALNVTDMVSKTYVGFESNTVSPLGTVAVVFGTTPGTGTAITGGGFQNDDVTQPPATDTTLDLGSDSTQTPGLFTSVTLTRPDSFALCAGTPSGGTDAQGNPICIFHGAAVAGQVAGKYVIFANINDPTAVKASVQTPLAVINVLLYQQ